MGTDKHGIVSWWYVRYPQGCEHKHRSAEAAERCGKQLAAKAGPMRGEYEVAEHTHGV